MFEGLERKWTEMKTLRPYVHVEYKLHTKREVSISVNQIMASLQIITSQRLEIF